MDKPTLKIDGKTIAPSEPVSMKVWRAVVEFDEEDKSEMLTKEFIEKHLEIIVEIFGRDEISTETLEENIAIEDVIPVCRKCCGWVYGLAFSKLRKIPNPEAVEADG